jgi:3-hydroxyisobutyrate dehydrogenase-like beta-hydroxyacid dehydrogenase
MRRPTIGILSPGDMGHAIGAVLTQHGMRVVAALDDRSDRTRRLAAEAGIQDIGTVPRLVTEADIVLSVLVPSAAVPAAAQVADAIRAVGKDLLYTDCNAIAPENARAIDTLIRAAGGRFVDAAIIGPPPRAPGRTRIYVSGVHAAELEPLRAAGLDIRLLGAAIGQASGLKMCYGALTKGLTAIGAELLIAARRMDLDAVLGDELSTSQRALLEWLARAVPGMPSKAHRWVGEMEEVAATFGSLGLPGRPYAGVADFYRFVAATPLGNEAPEAQDRSRPVADVIAALADEWAESTRA